MTDSPDRDQTALYSALLSARQKDAAGTRLQVKPKPELGGAFTGPQLAIYLRLYLFHRDVEGRCRCGLPAVDCPSRRTSAPGIEAAGLDPTRLDYDLSWRRTALLWLLHTRGHTIPTSVTAGSESPDFPQQHQTPTRCHPGGPGRVCESAARLGATPVVRRRGSRGPGRGHSERTGVGR